MAEVILQGDPVSSGTTGEMDDRVSAVARDGFAEAYSGVRISKSGRRFRIENGVLWQLRDASRILHGVAATFSQWTLLNER